MPQSIFAPTPESAPIVEWYRLDASRRMARPLGVGALGMTLGALVWAATFSISRGDPAMPLGARAVRAPIGVLGAGPTLGPHGELEPGGEPASPERIATLERLMVAEAAGSVLGILCVALGGLTAILGLRRVLAEDAYLALRTDGALLVNGDERTFASWDDIEAVRWDAERDALVLERREGEPWVLALRFAGVANRELVRRAVEVRRKSLFGITQRRA